MSKHTRYPSDLTDAQWRELRALLPPPKPGGRPRSVDLREVLNAILYRLRTGCQWRQLPRDLPPWGTVHYYFRRWRLDGTWIALEGALRRRLRDRLGREEEPSMAVLDSQTAKSTAKKGAGKLGRKQENEGREAPRCGR